MAEFLINAAVGLIAVLFVLGYWRRHFAKSARAREKLQTAKASGVREPVSLHPKLDPNRCIGIGACAEACPEGDIIAIVGGLPELVEPSKCIGHGTCAAACPVDAITLVFGTESRGLEIPHVKPHFETNVGGIYIAGELGGMGLIRNAVTQGTQAIDHMADHRRSKDRAVCDVAIIGAGPAGIAASLEATKKKLRYITLEQEDIGGTVYSYPRQKLVMTQPMVLPLYGKCKFREISKEDLLTLWNDVIKNIGVSINTGERLESAQRNNGHFKIKTSKGEYAAKSILLAIGRRGTPRKLDVEGERSPKVTYKLIDPEQYRRKHVLVVGGGDSAVEAALMISKQPGAKVSLSYRGDVFSRAKDQNRQQIESAIGLGKVEAYLESRMERITPSSVAMNTKGGPVEIDNDYVLVMIGGELPTAFLKELGITISMKFGEK